MYCQNCGHSLEGGAKFCPMCGHSAPTLRRPVNLKSSPVITSPAVAESLSRERPDELAPMSFKHVLFSIHGRIGRIKFLTGWVLLLVIYILTLLLTTFVTPNAPADTVFTSLAIVFLGPNIALWAKRLQDCNHSALTLLLLFIPIVGLAVVFFAFFAPGTKGPNKYGQAANVLPPVVPTKNAGEWH